MPHGIADTQSVILVNKFKIKPRIELIFTKTNHAKRKLKIISSLTIIVQKNNKFFSWKWSTIIWWRATVSLKPKFNNANLNLKISKDTVQQKMTWISFNKNVKKWPKWLRSTMRKSQTLKHKLKNYQNN